MPEIVIDIHLMVKIRFIIVNEREDIVAYVSDGLVS